MKIVDNSAKTFKTQMILLYLNRMSLFKSREWWYVHAGAGEEYDTCNLCIGNVDNSPDNLGKSRDRSSLSFQIGLILTPSTTVFECPLTCTFTITIMDLQLL